VGFANFAKDRSRYVGLGRFIPYLLFPHIKYSVHILPKRDQEYAISCGINPWNPNKDSHLDLGAYFRDHFQGGGHAFVAGGRLKESELPKVYELIKRLNAS
jgi:hypothetical protein